MKKSLLIAAFGLVSVGASAQSFEEKPILPETQTGLSTIPSCYCKDGKPYFVVHSYQNFYNQDTFESTYEDYGYSIYDENLSLVKQFPGMNSHTDLDFMECGNPVEVENGCFGFSQTLFNDDDAFEYLESEEMEVTIDDEVYDCLTVLKIMSENGRELTRITFEKPLLNYWPQIMRLGETDYLLVSGDYFDSSSEYGREDLTLFYKINKALGSRASIQKVDMPKGMKALPVLRQKSRTARKGTLVNRNIIVK